MLIAGSSRRSPAVIRATDGRPVWDLDSFGFAASEDAPETVNPSRWRQLRLLGPTCEDASMGEPAPGGARALTRDGRHQS